METTQQEPLTYAALTELIGAAHKMEKSVFWDGYYLISQAMPHQPNRIALVQTKWKRSRKNFADFFISLDDVSRRMIVCQLMKGNEQTEHFITACHRMMLFFSAQETQNKHDIVRLLGQQGVFIPSGTKVGNDASWFQFICSVPPSVRKPILELATAIK